MGIAMENAGADRGLLILLRGEEPQIEAEATTSCDKVEVMLRETPVTSTELPESVLHYVIRTHHSVILDDAAAPTLFSGEGWERDLGGGQRRLCPAQWKQPRVFPH